MVRRLISFVFIVVIFAGVARGQQSVGNYWPPTTVAGLANYQPPAGTFPITEVTDAVTCNQGQLVGGGISNCRAGWNGIKWSGISGPAATPVPLINIVQSVPAGTIASANSCVLNNFAQNDAVIAISKTCNLYPAVVNISDSTSSPYVGDLPTNSSPSGTSGGIAFFGSFQHPAGNITVTIGASSSTCYNLLECLEVKGSAGFDPTAGNGIAYTTGITTSQSGAVTPSLASVANPALMLGVGETEGPYTLAATATDYGTGGGSPTLLTTVPSASSGGVLAQMWTAFESVTAQTQHGFQVASVAGPPPPGCPSGMNCFTPFVDVCATNPNATGCNGVTFPQDVATGIVYGAGGSPATTTGTSTSANYNPAMPTLTPGFHTYTCTPGNNQAALNTAVQASGDLQILKGTGTCEVDSPIFLRSNQNIQCQDSTTVLFYPATGVGNSNSGMFELNGVSNISISNCSFQGANTPFGQPPTYPTCQGVTNNTCPEPGAFSFLIGGNSNNSHILIVDNYFDRPMAQCAVEFVNSGNTDVTIDWNSFRQCGLYGPDFDQVTNGHIDHNYGMNCRIGNEPDQDSYSLAGDTLNSNYATRNQYGNARNVVQPTVSYCTGAMIWIGCGNRTTTQGCTSANNKALGYLPCPAGTGGGGPNDNIEILTKSGAPNDGVNPVCVSANGCKHATN